MDHLHPKNRRSERGIVARTSSSPRIVGRAVHSGQVASVQPGWPGEAAHGMPLSSHRAPAVDCANTDKFSLEGTIFRPLEEQRGSSERYCVESSSSRDALSIECRGRSPLCPTQNISGRQRDRRCGGCPGMLLARPSQLHRPSSIPTAWKYGLSLLSRRTTRSASRSLCCSWCARCSISFRSRIRCASKRRAEPPFSEPMSRSNPTMNSNTRCSRLWAGPGGSMASRQGAASARPAAAVTGAVTCR